MTNGYRASQPPYEAFIHRFALEAPVRTPEPSGGAEVTHALIAEVWGDLRTIDGSERLDEDRLVGTVTHRISIRYRDDLTPDHRFRLGPRRFEIIAILDRDGRRRYLECRCREIVT